MFQQTDKPWVIVSCLRNLRARNTRIWLAHSAPLPGREIGHITASGHAFALGLDYRNGLDYSLLHIKSSLPKAWLRPCLHGSRDNGAWRHGEPVVLLSRVEFAMKILISSSVLLRSCQCSLAQLHQTDIHLRTSRRIHRDMPSYIRRPQCLHEKIGRALRGYFAADELHIHLF